MLAQGEGRGLSREDVNRLAGFEIISLPDEQFKQAWTLLTNPERMAACGPAGFNRARTLLNGHGEPPEELPDEPEWARAYAESPKPTDDERKARNIVNWDELSDRQPPPFQWLLDHWLSWHPTLLAGRGGIGKSLLAQQIETALATAKPLWGTSSAPKSVLAWHCEDDHDEIWRRQDRICAAMQLTFSQLNNLHIDARCGLENALFATAYGRPTWTPLYAELQQQVNDYAAEILVLDNVSQLFGGNINDPHHVTTFLNGIIGLVRQRPFCPVLLTHVAKAQGSEFTGAMAWENAVRMRWYFAEKLPGEADADSTDPGTTTSDIRFLCKRKANYGTQDYVQLAYNEGVFKPVQAPDTDGVMGAARNARNKTIVIAAVRKLEAMGIYGSEVKGTSYLPSKIADMKLDQGASKAELRTAMNALMVAGELIKEQVGKYAKGAPRFGLKTPPPKA